MTKAEARPGAAPQREGTGSHLTRPRSSRPHGRTMCSQAWRRGRRWSGRFETWRSSGSSRGRDQNSANRRRYVDATAPTHRRARRHLCSTACGSCEREQSGGTVPKTVLSGLRWPRRYRRLVVFQWSRVHACYGVLLPSHREGCRARERAADSGALRRAGVKTVTMPSGHCCWCAAGGRNNFRRSTCRSPRQPEGAQDVATTQQRSRAGATSDDTTRSLGLWPKQRE